MQQQSRVVVPGRRRCVAVSASAAVVSAAARSAAPACRRRRPPPISRPRQLQVHALDLRRCTGQPQTVVPTQSQATKTLKIGTRGSPLALAQAYLTRDLLKASGAPISPFCWEAAGQYGS